jgi:hypothetical protein
LEQAREDPKNAAAAEVLLTVVEKVEKEAGAALKTGGAEAPKQEMPPANADTATRATIEKKLSAPRAGTAEGAPSSGVTVGEMMSDAQAGTKAGPESTAAPQVPAQETPLVSPEPVPAPENPPAVVPEPKPLSSNPEPGGAVSSSSLASTEDIEEPAEPTDNDGRVETDPEGNSGMAVEKAAFLDRSAGIGVVPGLSRLMNRRVPNSKVDMAIFASILSLGLAGLWIEWRLPGRRLV